MQIRTIRALALELEEPKTMIPAFLNLIGTTCELLINNTRSPLLMVLMPHLIILPLAVRVE